MRRREFLALLGSAVLPSTGKLRAEQAGVPTIGILSSRSATESAEVIAALQRGLAEGGFVEGQNMAVEFRWAEGQYDRLPRMAADLVSHPVAVMITVGSEPSALAAKAATTTIPVVFVVGGDPVRIGLVDSLNRPSGNVTGVSAYTSDLLPKRLQLLHELVPSAGTLGYLLNPTNPVAESDSKDASLAAEKVGVQLKILTASTNSELEQAFAAAKREVGGLSVQLDAFFATQRKTMIALAGHHSVPVIWYFSYFVRDGGLMSYSPDLADGYRQSGVYASRILKGERLGNLPVQLPTKFDLVINLKTAQALGLEVPYSLLARADEVIE